MENKNNISSSSDCYILGIESSCDETAASIVKNGREMLSNVISSQIPVHKKFGGVVPEVASRKHIENIDDVIRLTLEEANLSLSDVSAIAVTQGPGLVGALLVGLQYAKGLALSLNKDLIGVNHIKGHVCANFIAHKDLKPPFVGLIVSGGHTFIVDVKDYNDFKVVAKTRDDAVGEAYDKVARALGLEYPGGPQIDRLAKEGNEDAIKFTRPDFHEETLDFSFSGIKSGVLNYINKLTQKGEEINKADIAASFQKSVITYLTDHVIKFCRETHTNKIVIAGGVASNSYLRKNLEEQGKKNNIEVLFPPPVLCTDNAAMIASAGYFQYMSNGASKLNINALPNLSLENEVNEQ